jgi:hypothetical protein
MEGILLNSTYARPQSRGDRLKRMEEPRDRRTTLCNRQKHLPDSLYPPTSEGLTIFKGEERLATMDKAETLSSRQYILYHVAGSSSHLVTIFGDHGDHPHFPLLVFTTGLALAVQ